MAHHTNRLQQSNAALSAADMPRRSRFDPPQPRHTGFTYTEADFVMFEKLDWHGTLPAPYFQRYLEDARFIKTPRTVYNFRQRRLTDFYNGYCEHEEHRRAGFPLDTDGKPLWNHECRPQTLLWRVPRLHGLHAKYQPEPYRLSTLAHQLLIEHGASYERTLTRKELRRSNSPLHDLFLGCFTASFELKARRFVFREEIISHPNCPPSTKNEDAPFYFSTASDHLYPDDIFGNEYEPGLTRLFALEIDCATESIEKTRSKLLAYNEVFCTAGYKRLGIPNMTVLYPTVTEKKASLILELVREVVDAKYQSRFLTKVYPNFATPWRVPSDLLETMVDWRSTIGIQDISKKAP